VKKCADTALARVQRFPGVPWWDELVVWRDRPPEADSASCLSQVPSRRRAPIH